MDNEFITAKIFIEAVLPNLPLIINYYEPIKDKFKNRNFVLQLRIEGFDNQLVINFSVSNGIWSCNKGQYNKNADIEFCFNNISNFNTYISGLGNPTPKIKGLLKLGLMMDVLAMLNKFATIMHSKTICEDMIDRQCQAKILLNILPAAISIIKSEKLENFVNNFSSMANIVVKSHIKDVEYNIEDVILKYAPENLNECAKEQLVEFVYPNFDAAAEVLLKSKFSKETVQLNNALAVEYIRFFVDSVNYFARLKYRN